MRCVCVCVCVWKWDGSNAQPATRKSGRAGQGKLGRTGQVCGVHRETKTIAVWIRIQSEASFCSFSVSPLLLEDTKKEWIMDHRRYCDMWVIICDQGKSMHRPTSLVCHDCYVLRGVDNMWIPCVTGWTQLARGRGSAVRVASFSRTTLLAREMDLYLPADTRRVLRMRSRVKSWPGNNGDEHNERLIERSAQGNCTWRVFECVLVPWRSMVAELKRKPK
ncbi:uncharacterized protein BDZ83DRAFT_243779 [Colletotrichum acutatum]|uniref:Uncharacterized protein n=1 Tax=Glomerella acutata TaxID=27357 RepID=A0AAD8XPN6_GLOAC|nr:uncharacterized protein BDZ83DRAFT_243779 [Colletotrichum acutatum]KAK1731250.1 hypothetical protein BDZ83DRAFT_243779 [Colletotrichum acutatum]